ncbi:MAG: sortase [Candidatus Microsaccharimonas sp.]
MMKKQLSTKRQMYGAVAVMNLFVGVMFVTVLFPKPEPVVIENVALVALHTNEPTFKKINLGIPIRVVVPSIGIDIPVRTGSYDTATQSWTLDTSSAFYADRSVPANDSNGATLIYAHAREGLFEKLPNISEGAIAEVYTDSGKIFSYNFQSSKQVKPDDTSIFVNSGAPMLTLQTCSGPYDVYRTLVSFSLAGVSS